MTKAAASAWVRMANDAPRTRWRKMRKPSPTARATGSTMAADSATHPDEKGRQNHGTSSSPL